MARGSARGWLLKSHSFLQRHADVACPEDATLPIVDGGYSVYERACVCIYAPVTMLGYRHVQHYGNSLQIKTAYGTRGCNKARAMVTRTMIGRVHCSAMLKWRE